MGGGIGEMGRMQRLGLGRVAQVLGTYFTTLISNKPFVPTMEKTTTIGNEFANQNDARRK